MKEFRESVIDELERESFVLRQRLAAVHQSDFPIIFDPPFIIAIKHKLKAFETVIDHLRTTPAGGGS